MSPASRNPYREARTAAGLSQEDVAKASGVHVRTISKLENGETVSARTVRRISEVLVIGDVGRGQGPAAPYQPIPMVDQVPTWNRIADPKPRTDPLVGSRSGMVEMMLSTVSVSLLIFGIAASLVNGYAHRRVTVEVATESRKAIEALQGAWDDRSISFEGARDLLGAATGTSEMWFETSGRLCFPLRFCSDPDAVFESFAASVLELAPEARIIPGG